MISFDTGIYKLTHKKNGKVYIGQSKHLKRRLYEHKQCESTENNKGSQSVIRRAIKKYGFDSFKYEIIIICKDGDYMDLMETKIINFYNSMVPNGYNVRDGGNKVFISEDGKKRISKANSGRVLTEKMKSKLSNSAKKYYLNNNRDEDWKNKLSNSLKNKPKSEEHKKKISEAKKIFIKNNPNSVKNMLGKKHSEETKKIMREKHLGIKHTQESIVKMKLKAAGRKKAYNNDGSWYWSKI